MCLTVVLALLQLLLAVATSAQFYHLPLTSYYSGHVYSPVSYAYKPSHVQHKLGAGVYANDAVSSFNYASKGMYKADSVGAKHYAKREADPALFYSHYMTPTVYTSGYSHYTTPLVYSKPAVHMPVHMKMKTYSNDAEKPFDYAGKGQYKAINEGAIHIAKREAEPYYNYFGNHHIYKPYTGTFSSYPYSTYSSYLYKREAEAEAEPFYSYYGNHHLYKPFTSTYTSYPYSTHSYLFKREAEAEPYYYGGYYGSSLYKPFHSTYTTSFPYRSSFYY